MNYYSLINDNLVVLKLAIKFKFLARKIATLLQSYIPIDFKAF